MKSGRPILVGHRLPPVASPPHGRQLRLLAVAFVSWLLAALWPWAPLIAIGRLSPPLPAGRRLALLPPLRLRAAACALVVRRLCLAWPWAPLIVVAFAPSPPPRRLLASA
ncbi:hypothetical protein NL676_021191 [Syzygium grande]|nr:hypothetical protein NL676_021191 [Syzygium grande]